MDINGLKTHQQKTLSTGSSCLRRRASDMKILCFIGIHKWIEEKIVLSDFNHWKLYVNGEICKRCKKKSKGTIASLTDFKRGYK